MYSIRVRNVNEAIVRGAQMLLKDGVIIAPRGIRTLEMPEPVVTTYANPRERVCFVKDRDANPFFHLFESLWILAGRNDVEWLAQFNSQMREYSDDGKIFHGAYGRRLRRTRSSCATDHDQIREVIDLLHREPDTRRAVLTIWDPVLDLNENSKDIPCNDMIFLKMRQGELNMTVCNRSNDMIWGAYGANVVQFSMLQEYIANKLGAVVGMYHQVSDSFHVYPDNPKWESIKNLPYSDFNPYKYDVKPYTLGAESLDWDYDLYDFIENVDPTNDPDLKPNFLYRTHYFNNVIVPMYDAWLLHRISKNGLKIVERIKASDWQLAAKEWLTKREEV